MQDEPDEVFYINLKNGEPVEVSWYKDYLTHADHLELRGGMTSTGYRSDFISKEPGIKLDADAIREHARQLAEKCWEENEEKYGSQAVLL